MMLLLLQMLLHRHLSYAWAKASPVSILSQLL